MIDYTEKQCPECGQQLRFPTDIGGGLMACPSCGNKFQSDFKLGGVKRNVYKGMLSNVFEMPYKIVSRICRFFLERFKNSA